jgi:fermentation-respiration switch protein FrsA (DUF1100 family)
MLLLESSIVAIAILYASAIVGLGLFQRKLLYFPDPRPIPAAQAGITEAEELRLPTGDGETLVAWHVPAREGRPLILYFHGNGGGLADRAPRFRKFLKSGYGLLAAAFRGYSGSTGSPTQTGLMLDGEAAYQAARQRGYSDERIVAMGESLGTGVAAAVAANHDVAALVLDSPYSSTADVAAARFPFAPVRWMMFDQFRSDLAIGNVRAPVLVVHGDRDDIVPIRFAERLFELANDPKTFIADIGAGHLVLGNPDVFPRVQAWIDEKTSSRPARELSAE